MLHLFRLLAGKEHKKPALEQEQVLYRASKARRKDAKGRPWLVFLGKSEIVENDLNSGCAVLTRGCDESHRKSRQIPELARASKSLPAIWATMGA